MQEKCRFFSRVGVSEVGFATTALARENLWFGKKKGGKVWDKESQIPGGPCSPSWCEQPLCLR